MDNDNRFVVLVDIDGVINDLPEKWVEWLNIKYGLNKKYEDIRYYAMEYNYRDEIQVNVLSKDAIYAPLHSIEFWQTVSFREGAIEYINLLAMHKELRLVICTSSLLENAKMKWEQLCEVIPSLSANDLIVCNDKSLARGDILIDDCKDYTDSFKGLSILIHAPYNNGCEEVLQPCNTTVAYSWKDVYDKVLKACETAKLLRAIS